MARVCVSAQLVCFLNCFFCLKHILVLKKVLKIYDLFMWSLNIQVSFLNSQKHSSQSLDLWHCISKKLQSHLLYSTWIMCSGSIAVSLSLYLYHCVTVLLYHCITVHLYHCITITVSLSICITVSLSNCITVTLSNRITVTLSICITV